MLIVSLTSYPLRIPTLHYTLFSLLTQTHQPHKIVLWLSVEEFPNKEQDLPQSVLRFMPHGVEIQWCEDNIKSYKKLIPSLQLYPEAIIVTCDDDAMYPKDWLAKLYAAYVENPQYIHCHRAHRVSFDEQGRLLPYMQWESCIAHTQTSPSFLIFFTGLGGVLYPPHCLHKDVLEQQQFLRFAPHQDDIWFWAMALLKETKINVVEENYTEFVSYVDFKKCGALWIENAKGGINDKVLQNILESYPALRQKMKFDSSEYWENRYKDFNATHNTLRGGGGYNIGASGAGSYNNLAAFKAKVLNEFVKEEQVQSVLEFGCGDGNQLSLAQYPRYIGLDVSKSALTHTSAKFSADSTKAFYLVDEFLATHPDFSAELTLSLDVIYHLIQDEVFDEYMKNLFAHSRKFVGIYSSNKDEFLAFHVKHRKFSAWIEANAKEWELYKFIPNTYPFDEKNPNHTSFADFYFYKKQR
ncbi:class I SAM-dependent methyltransferase [Helicobacter sp. MIT 21-1697]|uniref:class I SAM-dependent methyltransferase n=1 Tax=Helicobacter sp. MIT 21-1697 TaxID=2993733 RepID=UPI00224B12E4|nr:class I SAM-dependent methyltransferase [Helicobacter sp. MIT 21-1697]MCX2716502.1 class I SAM-dependent methyltransferase [Helicobacter sp. MIT 21-1697]